MIRATSDRRRPAATTTSPPVTAPAPLAVGLTYEQFLAWDGENQHVEWVNGEVIPMPPVSDEHMDLAGWLAALVRFFADARRAGIVRTEPFQMRAGPDLPGRSPDILFLARRNLSRLRRTFVDGPADLVVEVVSPNYRAVDAVEKFAEYQSGGVREYWLIDPELQRADFYRLARNGRYKAMPRADDGVFRSNVLKGFWLRVEWLWQDPLPPLPEVVKELGLT